MDVDIIDYPMDSQKTLNEILVGNNNPDLKIVKYVQVGFNEEQIEFLERVRKEAKIRTAPELVRRIINGFEQSYKRIKSEKKI